MFAGLLSRRWLMRGCVRWNWYFSPSAPLSLLLLAHYQFYLSITNEKLEKLILTVSRQIRIHSQTLRLCPRNQNSIYSRPNRRLHRNIWLYPQTIPWLDSPILAWYMYRKNPQPIPKRCHSHSFGCPARCNSRAIAACVGPLHKDTRVVYGDLRG